jgi:hypothetical protein
MPNVQICALMDQSTGGWWPQVLMCLLIQASIFAGGQLLILWQAPDPIPTCCAPPLVL